MIDISSLKPKTKPGWSRSRYHQVSAAQFEEAKKKLKNRSIRGALIARKVLVEGIPATEVAESFNISRQSVSVYVKRYFEACADLKLSYRDPWWIQDQSVVEFFRQFFTQYLRMVKSDTDAAKKSFSARYREHYPQKVHEKAESQQIVYNNLLQKANLSSITPEIILDFWQTLRPLLNHPEHWEFSCSPRGIPFLKANRQPTQP